MYFASTVCERAMRRDSVNAQNATLALGPTTTIGFIYREHADTFLNLMDPFNSFPTLFSIMFSNKYIQVHLTHSDSTVHGVNAH